ncbi:hypothetical protein BGZ88_012766 [Linnemannia elongata]|nr:hypothetical protein BGZ88_012766 [Linnemannia elongata]
MPVPVVQSLKRRRRLTTEESEFLMVQFNLNGRPTAQERDSFARHLKLDRRTIQVWFQNRRAKLKRDERGGCRQNQRRDDAWDGDGVGADSTAWDGAVFGTALPILPATTTATAATDGTGGGTGT